MAWVFTLFVCLRTSNTRTLPRSSSRFVSPLSTSFLPFHFLLYGSSITAIVLIHILGMPPSSLTVAYRYPWSIIIYINLYILLITPVSGRCLSPPLSVCISWKLTATSSLQRSAPLVSSLRALPLEVDRLQIFELNLELNLMC